MDQEKKKGLFRRDDRPDAQAEDTTPNLKFFFKLFGRKFGKILSLNLLMIFQVLPLVAALLIWFFGATTTTADSPLYAPLFGAQVAGSRTAALLIGTFSRQIDIPVLTPVRTAIIIALFAFLVLTWGWQNVGSVYNLRSMVRGDSCFLFSDYFYAIRRNLKQGFFFGILDLVIIAVLGFDIYYFNALSDSIAFSFMYIIALVLLIIYLLMRRYVYLMMITFDLSIGKLLKNAFIFVWLGILRNLSALLGVGLLIALNLAVIIPCLSVGFSVPVILPFFYFLAVEGFIGTYTAYPSIKRYMIDPLGEPNSEEVD